MPRRIALVYSANPTRRLAGMDMIRWVRMARGFKSHGYKAHLVTDRRRNVQTLHGFKVKSAHSVDWSDYDVVKVCYQDSIDLVPPHSNLIVRMCRVVDEERPRRDASRRAEILRQQQRISEIASIVAFNDHENAARWKDLYGSPDRILIVPTGCPESIPEPAENPFPAGRRILLHCGSLTSHRLPGILNRLARSLGEASPDIELHLVGKNSLPHYAGESEPLDPAWVHVHDPVSEKKAWQYILHADAGLALAPSADSFESELSKIYYYLRGGLPVVTESAVSNRSLISEVSHGGIAKYDDIADLVSKTLAAIQLGSCNEAVMRHMVARHGWKERARRYVEAIGAP